MSKIVEKTCLLEDVWNESSRLQPLMLTLIDDYASITNQTIFLGHLVNRIASKNSSKNFIISLFGTNVEHFRQNCPIDKSIQNIEYLNEKNFIDLSDIDSFESKILSMASKNAANVLIINSVNVFFLLFDTNDTNNDRNVARKFYQFLLKCQKYYQQIILIYHSMFDSSIDDQNETNISHISNVIIDFRLKNDSLTCGHCLNDGRNDDDKTIHCQVITKRKHQRIHLQIDEKHEHIRLVGDKSSSIILDFISQENLMKQKQNKSIKAIDDHTQLPQSTFRLTLTKQEQMARDNLILPYTKKQQNSNFKDSNIIYTYDKYDDFDDEDPDDDLDF